jgi:PAS domain S-box-containing protein
MEKRQVEESLRESEGKYRLLAENTIDAIWQMDMDLEFTYITPAVWGILGFTPEEWIGSKLSDHCSPEEMQKMMGIISQELENLETQTGVVFEIYFYNKQGEEIACEVSSTFVLDETGKPIGFQGTTRDITERKRAAAALRQSEERLAGIIASVTDHMSMIDEHYNIVWANDVAKRLFGPNLIGKKCYVAYHRRDKVCDSCIVAKTFADSEIHEHETGVIGTDGKKMDFWCTASVAAWHGDGRPSLVIEVSRDITERKRAAEALRESHEKLKCLNSMLRLMCDNLPEFIWTKDLQGRFMFVNKSCCEDLLNARDVYEPVGKTDIFFAEREKQSHPENPNYHTFGETCIDSDGAVLETKKVIRRDESGNIKGRFVILDIIKSPFWDENGELIGTVGCARDVTREREIENEREQLLAQNQTQACLMQGIMNTVPEGVLLLDANGYIALANPAAGRALAVLVAREDLSTRKPLTRLGNRPLAELLTSPPTKGLWHEVKADGRTFEIIARPMANGPEPENWVLVIRDVTQERESQRRTQQQERLVALGQLAAGVAHDFNNIMTTILLYTQMSLNAPDLPVKIRQRLETVSGQAYRATDLVQQILDFSRRAVLERRPMDLTPFLKEVVKLLERTVPESIEIRLTYGADEYTVHADPTRMQQAIMNLAVNARDAMPEGGELRIELERVQVESHKRPPLPEMEAGEWVRVRVSDTGSGIPPEVLPHIFEPFFTTKEVGKGTGLGLAQVYGIVKQHEGHVDVSTEVGAGTTFTLYLPALLVSLPEVAVLETPTYVQGQGETILVVEDNVALRKALAATLEALNYRVLEAADGREALDILEQRAEEVSLVLSDLVMPEMGGQALFHAMRQRGPNLPVVMLSGHPLESELEDLQTQGLAGWMLKPPDLEQLAQLLARALTNWLAEMLTPQPPDGSTQP